MNNTNKNNRLLKYMPPVALALLGAVCGYCYYRFVGCASGTCAITSNPYISTMYGGILGALLGSTISLNRQVTKKEDEAKD